MPAETSTMEYNLTELVLGAKPKLSLPTPRESYISRLIEVMNTEIGTYEDKQDVANRIYNTLTDALGIIPNNPDPYKPLKDSFGVDNLDELDAVELVMELECEFDITLPEDSFLYKEEVMSAMKIAAAIYEKINEPEKVQKERPRYHSSFVDDF